MNEFEEAKIVEILKEFQDQKCSKLLKIVIGIHSIDLDKEFKFLNEQVNTIDGVKIDFTDRWVHLRKSNTEPIIRLYAEAPTLKDAKSLVALVRNEVKPFL